MAFKSEESKFKFGIRFRATSFFYLLLLILTPFAAGYLIINPMLYRYMGYYDLKGVFQAKNDIILVINKELFPDGDRFLEKEEIKLYSTREKEFNDFAFDAKDFIILKGDSDLAWFVYPDRIILFDGSKTETITVSPALPQYGVIGAAIPSGLVLIYSDQVKNWLLTVDKKGNQNILEIPFMERCWAKTCNQQECHSINVSADTLLFYQNKLWHFGRTKASMYLQIISEGKASEWRDVGKFPELCTMKDSRCRFFGGFDKNGIFFLIKDYNSEKSFMMRFDGEKLSAPINYTLPEGFLFPIILNSENANALFFRNSWDINMPIQKFEITDAGPKNFQAIFRTYFALASYFISFSYVMVVLIIILVYISIVDRLMNKYRQITEADTRIATLFQRALALFVDIVVLAIPLVIIAAVKEPQYFDLGVFVSAKGLALLSGWLTFYLFLISILEGEWGISLGKIIMGIRVTTKEGKRPGLVKALVRNLLLVVDSLFGFVVAVSFIAYTKDFQRLGDLAAGTVVVKSKKADMPKEEK